MTPKSAEDYPAKGLSKAKQLPMLNKVIMWTAEQTGFKKAPTKTQGVACPTNLILNIADEVLQWRSIKNFQTIPEVPKNWRLAAGLRPWNIIPIIL